MQTILKVNVKTANIVVAIALLLGMPFFTVVGALSDRIGRKKLMMAGCLLGVLTYIPIYKAMERAAGNNVVTVKSARNKVTGAIALTAMTTDATGALVPAKEAPNPNLTMLVLLVFVQVLLCVPGVWADCGLSDRGVSGEDSLHVAFAAVSHRKRSVWRVAAADRIVVGGGHGEYLCRACIIR